MLLLIEICTAQFLWKYSTAPYIRNYLKMENKAYIYDAKNS